MRERASGEGISPAARAYMDLSEQDEPTDRPTSKMRRAAALTMAVGVLTAPTFWATSGAIAKDADQPVATLAKHGGHGDDDEDNSGPGGGDDDNSGSGGDDDDSTTTDGGVTDTGTKGDDTGTGHSGKHGHGGDDTNKGGATDRGGDTSDNGEDTAGTTAGTGASATGTRS